jgi:tetratricopeptide (TPR) repeat protein
MKKLLLPVLLLLATLCPASQAQRIPDDRLHGMIREGIALSGKQQYGAARRVFERAMRDYPAHPAGYLNLAILLQVMSLDFEVPVEMPRYLNSLEKAQLLAEAMTEIPALEAEGNYYIGMARSYLAYYHFRDGENWLSGLSQGLKATGFLEDCLEENPRAYDAMTGIGTYMYWKSKNMSFLTWTPFIDDERHAGIDMLRLAEVKAEYTAQQATNSLIWIYIEEERWTDAIKSAQRILRQFPGNRLFLWGLASAAEGKQDWRTAREAYRRIIASMDDEVADRRYIELQARAKIASMSYLLGDKETAKKECRWMLQQGKQSLRGLTEDGKNRIERRREEMLELQELLH